jgi:hypothetical protein
MDHLVQECRVVQLLLGERNLYLQDLDQEVPEFHFCESGIIFNAFYRWHFLYLEYILKV